MFNSKQNEIECINAFSPYIGIILILKTCSDSGRLTQDEQRKWVNLEEIPVQEGKDGEAEQTADWDERLHTFPVKCLSIHSAMHQQYECQHSALEISTRNRWYLYSPDRTKKIYPEIHVLPISYFM